MKRPLSPRLLTALDWVCRLVIAAVFLLAGVPKLLDQLAFAKAIANYRVVMPIIGQDYIYPVSIVLPALEIIAAVALFVPRWRKTASVICGGMLIMFIVLIGQAVLRGLNIDCGCFGTGGVSKTLASKVGIEKILEDVLWLGMCVYTFWQSGASRKRYSLDRASAWN